MDMFNTRSHNDQKDIMERHVAALRRKRYLRHVPIILVPENMLGYFHKRTEELASEIPNCYCVFENGKEKPGVAKDKTKTADYVTRTRSAFEQQRIMFEKDWVTVTGHVKERGRQGILTEVMKQLMRFGYDERMKLTGKYGAHQDDGAIAFMMFIYWSGAIERPSPGNPYRTQFPFLFAR